MTEDQRIKLALLKEKYPATAPEEPFKLIKLLQLLRYDPANKSKTLGESIDLLYQQEENYGFQTSQASQ